MQGVFLTSPPKKMTKSQITYRVSQKRLSFTKLSINRFATNIKSISPQLAAGSANAQFGKTQFFLRHPVVIPIKKVQFQNFLTLKGLAPVKNSPCT